jgi:hypothetical protein
MLQREDLEAVGAISVYNDKMVHITQNKICIPCIIGLVRILLYQMYIPSPAFRFRSFVSLSGR